MTEEPRCYGSPRQRDLLKTIAGTPLFKDFFLTGGTCLSVFYLHHRVSHDLDFFTTRDLDLRDTLPDLQALLRPQGVLATAAHFVSCVVDGVKLDFVVDPLSSRQPRSAVSVDGISVTVDVLENIGPNKISALISRTAPKDVVDCFVLYRDSNERFMGDYRIAQRREALLDDLMYTGEKMQVISETAGPILHQIGPDLRVTLSERQVADFYASLGSMIFRLGTEGAGPRR